MLERFEWYEEHEHNGPATERCNAAFQELLDRVIALEAAKQPEPCDCGPFEWSVSSVKLGGEPCVWIRESELAELRKAKEAAERSLAECKERLDAAVKSENECDAELKAAERERDEECLRADDNAENAKRWHDKADANQGAAETLERLEREANEHAASMDDPILIDRRRHTCLHDSIVELGNRLASVTAERDALAAEKADLEKRLEQEASLRDQADRSRDEEHDKAVDLERRLTEWMEHSKQIRDAAGINTPGLSIVDTVAALRRAAEWWTHFETHAQTDVVRYWRNEAIAARKSRAAAAAMEQQERLVAEMAESCESLADLLGTWARVFRDFASKTKGTADDRPT